MFDSITNTSNDTPFLLNGDMVTSTENTVEEAKVEIIGLSDQMVNISFKHNKRDVSFQVLMTPIDKDVIVTIQQQVTEDYILKGIEGFLNEHPHAHGGFVRLLNGFFFNISLDHFRGDVEELYFFGKPAFETANVTI